MKISGHKCAGIGQTAGTLRWRTLRLGTTRTALGRAVQRQIIFANQSRITADIFAFILIKATVAFLAGFYDFVAAEGAFACLETVALHIAHQHIEHIGNIAYGTGRKFGIIRTVSRGGAGKHNEVAIQTTRTAFLRIVMLKKECNGQYCSKTCVLRTIRKSDTSPDFGLQFRHNAKIFER